MKIALTNLGKYNEGRLVYTWLDLPFTEEEFENAKSKIGINERYEEYFISDTEVEKGEYPGKIGEYTDLDDLNENVKKYESYSESDKQVIRALCNTIGCDVDEAMDMVNDGKISYVYTDGYESLSSEEEKAAYAYIDQVYGSVSLLDRKTLEEYFDFESYGRDLLMNGGDYDSDEEIVILK